MNIPSEKHNLAKVQANCAFIKNSQGSSYMWCSGQNFSLLNSISKYLHRNAGDSACCCHWMLVLYTSMVVLFIHCIKLSFSHCTEVMLGHCIVVHICWLCWSGSASVHWTSYLHWESSLFLKTGCSSFRVLPKLEVWSLYLYNDRCPTQCKLYMAAFYKHYLFSL